MGVQESRVHLLATRRIHLPRLSMLLDQFEDGRPVHHAAVAVVALCVKARFGSV